MSDQDKIVQFLRMSGPSLPTKVAKHLNTQILLASAHLSDLASQGKVRISHIKIGGSPLYYIPGQEHQLFHFAHGNLNPKDLEVLNVLKERRVLREAELELLPRVALRSLKDFAVPLQVTVNGEKELFWKWHLLSDEETHKFISHILKKNQEQTPVEALPLAAAGTPLTPVLTSTPHSAVRDETIRNHEPMMETWQKPESHLHHSVLGIESAEKSLEQLQKPALVVISEKEKQKTKALRRDIEDEFFPVIEKFLKKLAVVVDQKETVRKNKEYDLLIKVPSAVGTMTYFCKAKEKTKCDEKDLSAAYMEAQIKKLPLLFLHSGELSKKAQEMLDSGAFENVMVRKI